MQKKLLLTFLFALILPASLLAQKYNISGHVLVSGTTKPVDMAVVEVPKHGLWAVSNSAGEFLIKGVPQGDVELVVSCLGYVTTPYRFLIKANLSDLKLSVKEDNLTLESVVITAKENSNAMATSRTVGGAAIDHLQMVNASDISALLPGGKTVNPNLLSDNPFSLRDGGQTVGNAAFGTAVEVDGVRLSTNASLGDMSGASTRNVASTNIESVEVITGVPSAEYGDVSSGIVKVHTRKGKTPYTVLFSSNPRTKQFSLSKGFDLGKNRGVLNTSVEYTRATKNPTSPYTSYSRTGISLNYNNTFLNVLRFNLGVTGNIGGVNTKDDPDAFVGDYQKTRDNAFRANTSLSWQINKPWITNLEFDASVNYVDNLDKIHSYTSNSSQLSAVHSEQEGYYLAQMLPFTYFATKCVDSKELDYAANLKAKWIRSWGDVHSNAKIGLAYRSNGNVGKGEYYTDPALAKDGYRPRPYTDIPFMHNFALYIEETLTIPIGKTSLQLMAGLRGEKTYISGAKYDHMSSLSPRLNLKYRVGNGFSFRAGWGITEKLPSFNILYPNPQYRDIQTFGASYNNNQSVYSFYTQPYEILYNEDLRWQRNRNAEVGLDISAGGVDISLVGYFNRTKNPYELHSSYSPISYKVSAVPEGYTMPTNPLFKVDAQSGTVFVRDADNMDLGWVEMSEKVINQTFVKNTQQDNGSAIDRYGVEMVVEFPQIKAIRTRFRIDGAYAYTKYINDGEAWYYPSRSHTSLPNRSYEYAGIYIDNGNSATSTYNGRKTHSIDANITATTHIPSIRLIVTLRLEASLMKHTQNLSEYQGKEYAFNVGENDNTPTGGSVYDGNSYTAIYPLYYVGLDGVQHPFTQAQADDPKFQHLILRSNNRYQYAVDGYDPYFSANLSITKEIGKIASISFYANNFTNSRRYVTMYATKTKIIMTPEFYYGLTLRLKF